MKAMEVTEQWRTHYEGVVTNFITILDDQGIQIGKQDLPSIDVVSQILDDWQTYAKSDRINQQPVSEVEQKEALTLLTRRRILNDQGEYLDLDLNEDRYYLLEELHLIAKQLASAPQPMVIPDDKQAFLKLLKEMNPGKIKRKINIKEQVDTELEIWLNKMNQAQQSLLSALFKLAALFGLQPNQRKIVASYFYPPKQVYEPQVRSLKRNIAYFQKAKCDYADKLYGDMFASIGRDSLVEPIINFGIQLHHLIGPKVELLLDSEELQKLDRYMKYNLIPAKHPPYPGDRVTHMTPIIFEAGVVNYFLDELGFTDQEDRIQLIQHFASLCGFERSVLTIKSWVQKLAPSKAVKSAPGVRS